MKNGINYLLRVEDLELVEFELLLLREDVVVPLLRVEELDDVLTLLLFSLEDELRVEEELAAALLLRDEALTLELSELPELLEEDVAALLLLLTEEEVAVAGVLVEDELLLELTVERLLPLLEEVAVVVVVPLLFLTEE